MRVSRILTTIGVAMTLAAGTAGAQTPAADPSTRLRAVLPADVAERVLATIGQARARELPAQALEQRALKFAARGVAPRDIERAVSEQAERMAQAKGALEQVRGRRVAGDEVEAGAEALRLGVKGAEVTALASSAPSGRSLAVPLFVMASLVDRGLPSDQALQRVRDRLQARATDAEIERLPRDLPPQATAGQGNRPAETGRDLAATKRPGNAGRSGSAGGPPAGVPGNAGSRGKPVGTGRPEKPGRP